MIVDVDIVDEVDILPGISEEALSTSRGRPLEVDPIDELLDEPDCRRLVPTLDDVVEELVELSKRT